MSIRLSTILTNNSRKTETGSSNHLLTGTEYAPSASTQVALDMIGSSVQAASGVVPRRLSPQKGLRKSFSDPTALTGATGIQSRRPGRSTLGPIDEGKSDQGPWTAEAMDLFDFWPPGRPKPKPG